MTDEAPSTNKMLKMLLPTMLPKAISLCFFKAAVTEVINSGRDVPTATIVNPTSVSLIPMEYAISVLLSTTNPPPQE